MAYTQGEPPFAMAETEQRVVTELVEYLRANPSAEDTIEGIAEWWSLEPRLTPTPRAQVQAAVAELTTRGVLEIRAHRDGRTTYRRRRTPPV